MTVKQRLMEFINYKKISVRSFESRCGLSYSYVNSIRVSIQPDKIKGIAIAYPDLITGWLLTGEGEMLKNAIAKDPEPNLGIDYREKYIRVLEKLDIIKDELVEAKDEISRLNDIIQSAKNDMPIAQGIVRGAEAS